MYPSYGAWGQQTVQPTVQQAQVQGQVAWGVVPQQQAIVQQPVLQNIQGYQQQFASGYVAQNPSPYGYGSNTTGVVVATPPSNAAGVMQLTASTSTGAHSQLQAVTPSHQVTALPPLPANPPPPPPSQPSQPSEKSQSGNAALLEQPEYKEILEEEKEFNQQYKDWRAQFDSWLEQNKDHPNRQQYDQYKDQWKQYEVQMDAKKEDLMKKKADIEMRLGITSSTAPPPAPPPEQQSGPPPPPPEVEAPKAAADDMDLDDGPGFPSQQSGYSQYGGPPPSQGGPPPSQGGLPQSHGGPPPSQSGPPPSQGGPPPSQGGPPQPQGGQSQSYGYGSSQYNYPGQSVYTSQSQMAYGSSNQSQYGGQNQAYSGQQQSPYSGQQSTSMQSQSPYTSQQSPYMSQSQSQYSYNSQSQQHGFQPPTEGVKQDAEINPISHTAVEKQNSVSQGVDAGSASVSSSSTETGSGGHQDKQGTQATTTRFGPPGQQSGSGGSTHQDKQGTQATATRFGPPGQQSGPRGPVFHGQSGPPRYPGMRGQYRPPVSMQNLSSPRGPRPQGYQQQSGQQAQMSVDGQSPRAQGMTSPGGTGAQGGTFDQQTGGSSGPGIRQPFGNTGRFRSPFPQGGQNRMMRPPGDMSQRGPGGSFRGRFPNQQTRYPGPGGSRPSAPRFGGPGEQSTADQGNENTLESSTINQDEGEYDGNVQSDMYGESFQEGNVDSNYEEFAPVRGMGQRGMRGRGRGFGRGRGNVPSFGMPEGNFNEFQPDQNVGRGARGMRGDLNGRGRGMQGRGMGRGMTQKTQQPQSLMDLNLEEMEPDMQSNSREGFSDRGRGFGGNRGRGRSWGMPEDDDTAGNSEAQEGDEDPGTAGFGRGRGLMQHRGRGRGFGMEASNHPEGWLGQEAGEWNQQRGRGIRGRGFGRGFGQRRGMPEGDLEDEYNEGGEQAEYGYQVDDEENYEENYDEDPNAFSDVAGEATSEGDFSMGRGAHFRGRGEFSRGRGDFGRGRGEFVRGRGEFGRGRGDFGRGRGDFGRGRGDLGRGDHGRGRGDFGRGRGEFGWGRGDSGRGDFGRGRGDFGRGRGEFGRGRGNFGRGRGAFIHGASHEDELTESDDVGNFMGACEEFDQGRGRGDFGGGRGDFGRGRGDFGRGRGDFGHGRGDFGRGRGDFGRGRGDFGPNRGDFARGRGDPHGRGNFSGRGRDFPMYQEHGQFEDAEGQFGQVDQWIPPGREDSSVMQEPQALNPEMVEGTQEMTDESKEEQNKAREDRLKALQDAAKAVGGDIDSTGMGSTWRPVVPESNPDDLYDSNYAFKRDEQNAEPQVIEYGHGDSSKSFLPPRSEIFDYSKQVGRHGDIDYRAAAGRSQDEPPEQFGLDWSRLERIRDRWDGDDRRGGRSWDADRRDRGRWDGRDDRRREVDDRLRGDRRDASPFRRDRSPFRRDRSPSRRDRSPLRRERSPPRRDRSPFGRERSPLRRERTPPRLGDRFAAGDRDWRDRERPRRRFREEPPNAPAVGPLFPAANVVGNMGNMPQAAPVIERVLVTDLLESPGRNQRPRDIVIILRGPPGSGKTHLSKMIKDKEIENGGAAPRILSLDDYFIHEVEKTVKPAGSSRSIRTHVQEYEYDAAMEPAYRQSLLKTFKKTVDDHFFPIIILDAVNQKVEHYEQFWQYARSKAFQVYVAEITMDVAICAKRNVHNRSFSEIQQIVSEWENTPPHFIHLDVRPLLQDASIQDVEMDLEGDANSIEASDGEEKKSGEEEEDDESITHKLVDEHWLKIYGSSKWETDTQEQKLDKLDGLKVRRSRAKSPQNIEEYLQLADESNPAVDSKGKKRVRWADIEKEKEQKKARDMGFVLGQTDWHKMTDDSYAEKALNRTKYF